MLRNNEKINFPYPVLCPYNEDINGDFEMKIADSEVVEDKFVVKCEINLSNEKLNKMIINKEAFFWIEIDCKSTKYHLEKEVDDFFEVSISVGDINEKLDFYLSVVSSQNNNHYYNENSNSDYDGHLFAIRKGDYLALAESQSIDIKWDTKGSNKSIFGIVVDKNMGDDEVRFDPDPERIWIKVSEKNSLLMGTMFRGKKEIKTIMENVFVIPALIDTLVQIKSSQVGNSFEDAHWYPAILEKLKELHFKDIQSIPY